VKFKVKEHHPMGTCAALGQRRSTRRKLPGGRDDEPRLTADIHELARQYEKPRSQPLISNEP
jgi:hypothetical protein